MYHPTGRVLTLLELLQSRSQWTAPQLADRLECDVRTVRRYVGKLLDVGIPVESEPGPAGGYRLRPGYRVPPLMFSNDEALAVVLGLLGTAWLGLSLPGPSVRSALSKVLRVLPDAVRSQIDPFGRVFVPALGAAKESSLAFLVDLVRAASENRCVGLEYRSRDLSTRTIEPYGVAGYQGHWYVVGFCRLRQALRVFRIDRIVAAQIQEEKFQRPPDFDLEAYIREGLEDQPWRVRLRFLAEEADVRAQFADLGTFTPQGTHVLYEGPTSDLDLLARQLLLSRLPVQVLDPPELRQAFQGLAQEAQILGTTPNPEPL